MIGAVSNNTFPFQVQYKNNLKQQNEVLTRLATGWRINSGKDDPAGLIAATQLETEIAALDAESRAIQRTQANANITEGHARQISGMMSDLRRLTVASANTGGMSDAEIQANQLEIDALAANVQRFAQDTISSLDGISLPDNGNAEVAEQLRAAAQSAATLASGGENDLRSGNFEAAETAIREATTAVAEARGRIGAYQKHTLESRQNSLAVERENLAAAHSRIRDADFAEETSNLARSQVLTASSLRVLKVANNTAGSVLSLLSQ
ncbi:MAG: flagellin [Planctomycetes bacterium]|nr:flagellin [Planctomycetota bacterium]